MENINTRIAQTPGPAPGRASTWDFVKDTLTDGAAKINELSKTEKSDSSATANIDKDLESGKRIVEDAQKISSDLIALGIPESVYRTLYYARFQANNISIETQSKIFKAAVDLVSSSNINARPAVEMVYTLFLKLGTNIDLVSGVIDALKKYEQEYPNLGLWQVAFNIAIGAPGAMARAKSLISTFTGVKGELNGKNLAKALHAIIQPFSSAAQELVKNRMMQEGRKKEMETLYMQKFRIGLDFQTQRWKQESGYLNGISTFIRGAMAGPFGTLYLNWWRMLTAISVGATMKDQIFKTLPGNKMSPQTGSGKSRGEQFEELLGKGASVELLRKVLAAPVVNPYGSTITDSNTLSGLGGTTTARNVDLEEAVSLYESKKKQRDEQSASLKKLWSVSLSATPDPFSGEGVDMNNIQQALPADATQAAQVYLNLAKEVESLGSRIIGMQTTLQGDQSAPSAQEKNILEARLRTIKTEQVDNKQHVLMGTNMVIVIPIEMKIVDVKMNRASAKISYDDSKARGGYDMRRLTSELVASYNEEIALRSQAYTQYMTLSSSGTAGMNNFFMQLAKRAALALKGLRTTASSLVLGLSPAYKTSSEKSKYLKTGDAETEEYWDELLPGMGTAMEHPGKYRKVKTDDIKPHHSKYKIIKK
jgi:hypothetical protein